MRRTSLVVLVAAVVAGGILRFAALGSVPGGLYCDEAFHGWEARCLLETGADSGGRPLPLFFDIFGVGWEEPLYVYLTILPVGILGNVAAATRIPAAAAGTLALLAVAALAARAGGRRAAAGAALLMAVSPWAFHFSRIGFQASLLPLALASGAALLARGLLPAGGPGRDTAGRGERTLLAGTALLGLALYTYVAARVLVPLLLIGWAACAALAPRPPRPRALAIIAAAALLVALPAGLFSLTPEGRERFQDVGLASRFEGREAAARFFTNYLSYLSPSFLLTSGDPNPRHSIPGFGALHAHDLVFLLLGVAAALVRRRPIDLFLLWWLAIAPLPAALAADPVHAVRAIGAIPPLYALAGAGAAALFDPSGPLSLAGRRGRTALAALLIAGAASAGSYLYHYFVIYPVKSGEAWQEGLREAFAEAETLAPSHDAIYVTRAEDFPWVHRLYLFSFPPAEYQEHRFSRTKYLFDEPVFYRGGPGSGRERPLFLLKPHEVPDGLTVGRTILRRDGSTAFVLAW